MLLSFSRHRSEQVNDGVEAYSEMILTRMRNLKPFAKYIFTSRNNLHNEVRTSLIKLMQKVRKPELSSVKLIKMVRT